MDKIMAVYTWVLENKEQIITIYLAIIGLASIIVKMTPTLKDDNILKGIISFIGKFIALDKYGPKSGAPTTPEK